MPTLLLVRHGRTAANAAGLLAGWTPGVDLDDTGRQQTAALGQRLAQVPLAAVVSSPLERTRQTAEAICAVSAPTRKGAAGRKAGWGARPPVQLEDRLGEVHYGDWNGQEIKKLAKHPLWQVVQSHPSAVVFPGEGGEAMRSMQERAVGAVREHNARVADEHGEDAVWVAVSHGDVIKAILADALGTHLDQFQRIMVDPASVSIIRYSPLRPFVVRINDTGGDLSVLVPPVRGRRRPQGGSSSDAPVGGGAGTS